MGIPSWQAHFLRAILSNLMAPTSDHNPILFDTSPTMVRHMHRAFHFENSWFFEGDLKNVVRRSWHGFRDLDFLSKLG